MSLDIYQEQILDHYQNPRNKGKIDPSDIAVSADNPLCGDHIDLTLAMDKAGRVADVKFVGQGCAISMAAMSMLSDQLKGKTVPELQAMQKEVVLDLLGIPLSPTRLRCALLSLNAVQTGTTKYTATHPMAGGP